VWCCVRCKDIGTEWWRWRRFLSFSSWVPAGVVLRRILNVWGFPVTFNPAILILLVFQS
jgi:hypothetical protein